MTKKDENENVLALGPMAPDLGASTDGSLAAWSSRRALTVDEKGIIDELHKQKWAIEAITAKTLFGESKIHEIHQHTATTFDETVSFIVKIKDGPERGKEAQAYIDQFSQRQIQLLAQHLLGVLDVSATSIGMEIHRSPYPESEPRSFWKLLFG